MTHYPGEHVRLEDGETGVVITAAEDGTVKIKTETGIVVSSLEEDDE